MESKAAIEAALGWATREHGIKDATIIDAAQANDPASGQRLLRLRVASLANPNGAAHVVLVDEDGHLLERTAAREALFTPAPGALVPMPVDVPPITISPSTNDLVLHEGEVLDETLTVTVPPIPRTPIDVYFLIDTTGSMTDIIAAVKAAAVNILSALDALHLDIGYGVGEYRDFPRDAFAFRHLAPPTPATLPAIAALNSLAAAGGGDLPEAAFFALDQLAQPAGGSIGWRAGAQRLIVWIGDAPSHDPICSAISGLSYTITEASVTAKLVAEHIQVIAVSTATPGLETAPAPISADYGVCGTPGGSAGQASRIAAATGGAFTTGVNPGTVAATLISLITAALGTITRLTLSPSASLAPFIASLTPAAGYGPINRDVEHMFPFQVRFVGIPCRNEAQVFTGTIDVVADGRVVAAKRVRITIPPCDFIYSVKFVCGTQKDKDCHCTSVRPGQYATEINIHNPYHARHTIVKRFIPLVLAGAPVGREPRVATARAERRVVLPPHGATMDDCCSISEALFDVPGASDGLTIGILEIIAPADLAVTAVYTAGSGDDVSIEVVQVGFRRG